MERERAMLAAIMPMKSSREDQREATAYVSGWWLDGGVGFVCMGRAYSSCPQSRIGEIELGQLRSPLPWEVLVLAGAWGSHNDVHVQEPHGHEPADQYLGLERYPHFPHGDEWK